MRPGISAVRGDFSHLRPDVTVQSRVSYQRPGPSVAEIFSPRTRTGTYMVPAAAGALGSQ